MTIVPTQRAAAGPGYQTGESPYQTWEGAGLNPETTVELGDGTSMTLRELLDETPEEPDDE